MANRSASNKHSIILCGKCSLYDRACFNGTTRFVVDVRAGSHYAANLLWPATIVSCISYLCIAAVHCGSAATCNLQWGDNSQTRSPWGVQVKRLTKMCWRLICSPIHPRLLMRVRFKPSFRPGYFLLQLSNCTMETCMLLVGVRVHEHWWPQ